MFAECNAKFVRRRDDLARMPYRSKSEYPMKYLSGITLSFPLACSAPVSAAKTDTDNTSAKAVGEYSDIRLDCEGG